VTSLGECFNYLFDSRGGSPPLARLFRRVYGSLAPGGVFIFDIAEPGQVRGGAVNRVFTEGEDWIVLVEKQEDPKQRLLTRRIISLRKLGDRYRRSDEVHRQRLYKSTEVASELRRAGFRVRMVRSYGEHPLPEARAAFIARKPA
ncbi:MAG TPA: class I SAM-dependent methyltransferase, partial [Blastocatellia bacterium]|nr:class I SAM-dependent methyltransferase [Blastocatellia bacterium]